SPSPRAVGPPSSPRTSGRWTSARSTTSTSMSPRAVACRANHPATVGASLPDLVLPTINATRSGPLDIDLALRPLQAARERAAPDPASDDARVSLDGAPFHPVADGRASRLLERLGVRVGVDPLGIVEYLSPVQADVEVARDPSRGRWRPGQGLEDEFHPTP